MKTDNYCVNELDYCEAKKINGGIGGLALLGGMLCIHYAIQFAGSPRAHIDAFKEGMQMAK